jgi:hypothetical protein
MCMVQNSDLRSISVYIGPSATSYPYFLNKTLAAHSNWEAVDLCYLQVKDLMHSIGLWQPINLCHLELCRYFGCLLNDFQRGSLCPWKQSGWFKIAP